MNNEEENNDTLNDALRSYGLKQDIKRIHSDMMQSMSARQKSAPVKSMFPVLLRVAAAILILVAATGIFVYTSSTPESLFENKYHPYEQSAQRGDNVPPGMIQKKFEEGQSYLRNGDAESAIITFAGILNENARSSEKVLNDDAEYYLALAYLKDKQPENALPILEKIHSDKNHLYHDEVTSWYLLKTKIAAWRNK